MARRFESTPSDRRALADPPSSGPVERADVGGAASARRAARPIRKRGEELPLRRVSCDGS